MHSVPESPNIRFRREETSSRIVDKCGGPHAARLRIEKGEVFQRSFEPSSGDECESSSFFRLKNPTMRCQYIFAATPIAAIAAIRPWIKALPVPGSIYAFAGAQYMSKKQVIISGRNGKFTYYSLFVEVRFVADATKYSFINCTSNRYFYVLDVM
jgi:hypothetical protein